MKENNTFLVRWYGPFVNQEDEQEWEETQDDNFNLYLIYGKRKYARNTTHYYIGKTIQGVCNRFKNKAHHILEFTTIQEIWVGKFANLKPTDKDIRLVEKMLTSYMGFEVDKKRMLNRTNFYAPNQNIYLISEWYNSFSIQWVRHKAESPARIIPDVIAYKLEEETPIAFIANKLKKKW